MRDKNFLLCYFFFFSDNFFVTETASIIVLGWVEGRKKLTVQVSKILSPQQLLMFHFPKRVHRLVGFEVENGVSAGAKTLSM